MILSNLGVEARYGTPELLATLQGEKELID